VLGARNEADDFISTTGRCYNSGREKTSLFARSGPIAGKGNL
jgi:hypothetical protein